MKRIVMLLLFMELVLVGCTQSVYIATTTFTYSPIYQTSTSYIVPEVPAVSTPEFETVLSYLAGKNSDISATLACGVDIPLGDTTISISNVEGNYNPLVGLYDEKGELIDDNVLNSINTAQYYGNDEFYFTCEEGNEIIILGAQGDIKITQEAVNIPKTPEYEVEEMLSYDPKTAEYTCTSNGEALSGSCEELKKFKELNSEISAQISSDLYVSGEEVVEEMRYDAKEKSYLCTSNGEVVENCQDLKQYETLQKDIDEQLG